MNGVDLKYWKAKISDFLLFVSCTVLVLWQISVNISVNFFFLLSFIAHNFHLYSLSDEKSFESLSELDRGFFTDQSLLSTSSPAVESLLSPQTSPSQLALPASPLSIFHSPETMEVDYMCGPPMQGMFSTPQVFLQRHWKAPVLEQVLREHDTSHMSWDLSLIKLEDNSPKVSMEPGVLKQTCSPQLQLSLLAEDCEGGSDRDVIPAWSLETGGASVEEGSRADLQWPALPRVKPRWQLMATWSVSHLELGFSMFVCLF